MGKRAAEVSDNEVNPLKDGERPLTNPEHDSEAGDYEDDYEDEFESEDEIFEAGVDGRPDEEREDEERRGMWTTPKALCEFHIYCGLPRIF